MTYENKKDSKYRRKKFSADKDEIRFHKIS